MNHLWLSKEQSTWARKNSQKMECLSVRAFSTYRQTHTCWNSCGPFDREGSNCLCLCYNSMDQPELSGLEGIHLLLNTKGGSTFIVLHVLSHPSMAYRHAMEFQMALHYHLSLCLGGITRKLDFKDDLNDYKVVIIRNLVHRHGKALTMETVWAVWAKHVKTTNTWKGSHE